MSPDVRANLIRRIVAARIRRRRTLTPKEKP